MMQDQWNHQSTFRPSKSAPSSPVKPLGVLRTRSDSFHITHKVPMGDTPYVKAKNAQLVEKDPEKAIPLFWAAINAGDRVDSALKDMAIVMKQQNRAEEAIQAIKSLRNRCSDQAQESLDNILLDLYKRCGRLGDQIELLKHKLYLIQKGMAFNGKPTKTARSQGKKFQVSVEQEANRLLGNLGWALMQKSNYIEAEDAYRRALLIASDNNKMCNLGICLMKQGRIIEAKETLRRVRPAMVEGPRGVDSHLKAFERAQQMLQDLETELMNKVVGDGVEKGKLLDSFLGSSSIWQPQPCREETFGFSKKTRNGFSDENVNSLPKLENHQFVTNNNLPLNKSTKLVGEKEELKNSFNVTAKPFYSSEMNNQSGIQFRDHLGGGGSGVKRIRLINNNSNEVIKDEFVKPMIVINQLVEQNNKTRRRLLPNEEDKEFTNLLPDKAFEEAIIAAVLGSEEGGGVGLGSNKPPLLQHRNFEKRLRVFQDITLCLSPKA